MNYNFQKLKKEAIIKYLSLDKYKYLNDNLYKCDTKEYQTIFNSFYKVRRNANWRKIFYKYFESIKDTKDIKYEDIITYLYKETGNVETSFSSKVLATINPNMPILDRNVLSNLKLKIDGKTKEEKFNNAIKTYYKIIEIENEMLNNLQIQKFIKEFKELFPEYELSNIKILDCLLWKSEIK